MTGNPEQNTQPAKSGKALKVLIGLVLIICLGTGGYFVYQQKASAQEQENEPASTERADGEPRCGGHDCRNAAPIRAQSRGAG